MGPIRPVGLIQTKKDYELDMATLIEAQKEADELIAEKKPDVVKVDKANLRAKK